MWTLPLSGENIKQNGEEGKVGERNDLRRQALLPSESLTLDKSVYFTIHIDLRWSAPLAGP
jgi:hypothetical protein